MTYKSLLLLRVSELIHLLFHTIRSLLGRHENGLSLEIRFKPFVTTAPTNPGHLVSAKGYGGGHLQSVHADVSGSDPARDVIRALCITAKARTAQPEVRQVGNTNCIVDIFVRHYRQNGAEYLLLRNGHGRGDVREDRRI